MILIYTSLVSNDAGHCLKEVDIRQRRRVVSEEQETSEVSPVICSDDGLERFFRLLHRKVKLRQNLAFSLSCGD